MKFHLEEDALGTVLNLQDRISIRIGFEKVSGNPCQSQLYKSVDQIVDQYYSLKLLFISMLSPN
jgi:hypothetical protein